MEEYCTCGARLPEDARFCHKCGRPLRDEPLIVEEAIPVETAPSLPPPPVPPEIGFRNPIAVRTAFIVASLALAGSMLVALAGSVPLYLLGAMVLAPASGLVAVWMYGKRTGQQLSVRAGAKLGFITGVFGFVYSTVLNTLSTLSVASKTGIVEQYREQLDKQGLPPEAMDQVMKLLDSPATVVAIILIGMAFSFVAGTVTAALGGALGAKVLDKD